MNEKKRFPKGLLVVAALLLSVVVVVAGYFYIRVRPYKLRSESIGCRSRLSQIGLLARMWAIDHQERFPTNLADMRTFIGSPKLFICPSDSSNPMREVTDWSAFDFKFSSYELLSPGMRDGDSSTAFARCKQHGHACYGDGSVIEKDDARF